MKDRRLSQLTLGGVSGLALSSLLAAWGPFAQALGLGLGWLLVSALLMRLEPDIEGDAPASEENSEVLWVLDSSALVDGRLLLFVEQGLLVGRVSLPRFVMDELQFLADRSSKAKRASGRRGLEQASRLKQLLGDRLRNDDDGQAGHEQVDQRLLTLSEQLGARLVSLDGALLERARARGLAVFDLADFASRLKPPVLVGESWLLHIVKRGESRSQGVGYRSDGTMVVVEGAAEKVGEEVRVEMTSTIKTRNGLMIFDRIVDEDTEEEAACPS